MNYPVGDFLIQVKNAALAKRKSLEVKKTNLIYAVAMALKKEGYLSDVSEKDGMVMAVLSYAKRAPVLLNLHLVSKPGLRIYIDADHLERRKKPSILIVSTSKGVMSSREAAKKRVGGEVIAEIL